MGKEEKRKSVKGKKLFILPEYICKILKHILNLNFKRWLTFIEFYFSLTVISYVHLRIHIDRITNHLSSTNNLQTTYFSHKLLNNWLTYLKKQYRSMNVHLRSWCSWLYKNFFVTFVKFVYYKINFLFSLSTI